MRSRGQEVFSCDKDLLICHRRSCGLDGIDHIPHLREGAAITTRQIFWRAAGMQAAVRDGDWKFLNDDGRWFLFNVRTDPDERDDHAARRPDIVRRLAQLFGAWRKDVGTIPLSPQK